VLGLVASRLAERPFASGHCFKHGWRFSSAAAVARPAVSILHSAVEATRDIITRGGGHQAACGMTVPAEQI
jgi:single-stranded DNA-specific DHH superfamily exonuclease